MPRATNSGVHAGTGFEFQKHCALYILIRDYQTIKSKRFFICLEHQDDFLFCFEDNSNEISHLDAYQTKKASATWTISKDLCEILHKISLVALDFKNELQSQQQGKFEYGLHFGTNSTIELKTKLHSTTVNEANHFQKYADLQDEIKDKISSGMKAIGFQPNTVELNKTVFLFFDFSKTAQAQVDQLVGAFGRVFGSKVADHSAAVKTLLGLFRQVELIFNQGGVAKILDRSKRIESHVIFDAISIIENKNMAFNLWREHGNLIANTMNIPISQRESFRLNIQSSFDMFKDLKQVSHIKILNFVKTKSLMFESETNELVCIEKLYQSLLTETNLILPENAIKAAVIAAYIEVREGYAV